MDFAIIKTGGKQYIAEKGKKLKVEKLEAKEGDSFIFKDVLLLSLKDDLKIGEPLVEGAKVEGKVIKQDKAKKEVIFKYKAKKRYKVKKGHRQPYTEVEILKID
jgi:large subunit ribosomal protein L21